jgi:hypothetical protein
MFSSPASTCFNGPKDDRPEPAGDTVAAEADGAATLVSEAAAAPAPKTLPKVRLFIIWDLS